MKNVVAYTRVSTDGQLGEDKFGLDAQKEMIEKYCRKNDMNIVKWYTDEGESGAKLRPGLDEIVFGEVTNPPFEAVVVAKTDRVARDFMIYYYYKSNLLIRKNIELISVTEDFGPLGEYKDMIEAFIAKSAELERENISKRTSAGRKLKAKQGGYSGGKPPFGYMALGNNLVIEKTEAACVKRIFELHGSGMAIRKIGAILEEEGYKTRSGEPFAPSTILGILKNRPLYEGLYRYGAESEWVKGQHEAILKGVAQ